MSDKSNIKKALAKLHSVHTNLGGLESYAVTEEQKRLTIDIMEYQIKAIIDMWTIIDNEKEEA